MHGTLPNRNRNQADFHNLQCRVEILFLESPATSILHSLEYQQFFVVVFSQINGIFHFPKYNVEMKFGLAQLVKDWMQTPSTSSILYDFKFVMSMIIGQQNLSSKIRVSAMH